MSTATSTDTVDRSRPSGTAAVKAPDVERGEASALRPWHFFVVCAMLAATVAVLTTGDNSPANLVFISAAVISAGFVGIAFHRTLSPLAGADAAEPSGGAVGGRGRAALEREKMLVLRSIKELEFDRAMGKVADPDFEDMVARLRVRAIGLMRQLDDQGLGYRDLIERELRERIAARGKAAPSGPRASGGVERVPGAACPTCGTRNDADARFCKRCGSNLAS